MKSIKHRLLSLLLTLVTVLSLLPTAAFAASNTGSGLKITTNQAYWSTRLLANGTPYSYRPPLVDGKLVYCMDSGLGYHYATPSYLNSFTWTSGTGADADAVLQSAVTNSGLSEMDAATVENVKWMMTYLNDCKASNVGQLFMAVQTYVWDHQSYKGEPGGDGDAGGYANADTYDLYLSLIDWLLEQKAQEDAEFQRQIEEYTAQGKSASIVEDQSAKWAVYAISSNRKNQSFFDHCFIFQGQFFHFCPIHWNGEVEDNLPDPVAIRLPFREQLDSLDKCPHKFFSLHLGGGFIDLIERQQ